MGSPRHGPLRTVGCQELPAGRALRVRGAIAGIAHWSAVVARDRQLGK